MQQDLTTEKLKEQILNRPRRKLEFDNPQETKVIFGEIVQEINHRINAGIDWYKILDYVFSSLELLIPYDRIGIAEVDKSGESVVLNWVRSRVDVKHLKRNYTAPLKGSSLERILQTGDPRIIEDLRAYAVDHPASESTRLALLDGVQSSLTCTLISNGKPVGLVFFSSFEPKTYRKDHIEIFRGIANEIAVIVEQGRLRRMAQDNSTNSETLRNVLHDLRSPLSVIQGFLDISAEEPWYETLEPEAQNIFGTLRRNTKYMFELLSDLSEYSQLVRKTETINPQVVSPIEFCSEMAKYGNVIAKAKDIHFIDTFENLPMSVKLDPDRVRRVLDNLFSNAVKFSRRGSQILFSVSGREGRLNFVVSDQGEGIAEEDLPKLFKEFGKTATRPTEGESSTGLGLAIAKRIVNQHGGDISVRSKPKSGSTFSFWLPV